MDAVLAIFELESRLPPTSKGFKDNVLMSVTKVLSDKEEDGNIMNYSKEEVYG